MKKEHRFGNVPIFVQSAQSENQTVKKDIIFIHMSWGGTWAFNLYLPFFAEHGYNAYALDLRGHGKSGGTVEGTTMQNYVEDVHTVVTKLGVENPIIVGHSMGGLVALMYTVQHKVAATIALDASPTLEVQKTSEEKKYPLSYTATDAGMPGNPMKAMRALSDIPLMRMMSMKMKLGVESGIARSERKKGISVPKEKLMQALLFIGAGNGTSLPFGIGIEKVRAQAEYYNASVVEIKGASHPGLLIGKHWKQTAETILDWLNKK